MEQEGILITLEGPDGSGKTTNFHKLIRRLMEEGYGVVGVREPGGTRIGDKVRGILLDPESIEMGPRSEFFLFGATRAQVVGEVIRPALKRGDIVLCDRFSDSTTVYQGYARGLPMEMIQEINMFATGGLVPDLTLLFDLPVEISIERKGDDLDRIEQEKFGFYEKVRAAYLKMAEAEPERWRKIDGNRSREEVWQDVWGVVSSFLAGRNKEGGFLKGKERMG